MKTPIAPVETPNEVLAAISQPPARIADEADKYGAEELTRVVGISYRSGQPLKRTMFRRIQVRTQSGVAEFTKLTFEFDPSSERFYVNRLAVFDPQGNQVAQGSVDSYYVLDDSSSGMATHAAPGVSVGAATE